MPITEILEHNAKCYGNDVALVEINPQELEDRHITWRDYSLMEPTRNDSFRSEITWSEFDRKANRMANFLLTRHIRKGSKVAILLMNGIEWLPVYFGILKSGAMAVPLNFRYTAGEIKYCLELADVDMIIFGPTFTGRLESICDRLPRIKAFLYVGEDCPSFAESYNHLTSCCSSKAPAVKIEEDDEAAIYFSSGRFY
ncbi:MAG: acyl--CoA ligase, partial [Lentisphaeria bacterium]|nr:acyl--CoA ligase [Lentisphaeria bacterium]